MRKVTERAGRNLHFLAFFVPLTSPSHRSLAFSFEKDVERREGQGMEQGEGRAHREGVGGKSNEKGWNKEEMRKNCSEEEARDTLSHPNVAVSQGPRELAGAPGSLPNVGAFRG